MIPNPTILHVLVVCAISYVVQMVLLRVGLHLASRRSSHSDAEPKVSVIVAARNEEEFIGRCVASLVHLEYPPEKLEIIIVDDGSTDRTSEIAGSVSGDSSRVKVLRATPGSGNLIGKANALSQGINAASGEIIMLTDADCEVRPGWIRNTLPYFDKGTGVVGGFTVLGSGSLFAGIQCLDWLFLFGLASSTAGWGIPLTVIGNNFAFRKSCYEEVGGYKSIPFSVTEDYALVRAMLRKTSCRVRFPVDPENTVSSIACTSVRQLYHQKQRWGVGGLDMVAGGMLLMAVGWTARLALMMMPFFAPWSAVLDTAILILLADLLFLWKPMVRFGKITLMAYFLPFEIYLTLYVLVLPFAAFFSRKVIWKERRL